MAKEEIEMEDIFISFDDDDFDESEFDDAPYAGQETNDEVGDNLDDTTTTTKNEEEGSESTTQEDPNDSEEDETVHTDEVNTDNPDSEEDEDELEENDEQSYSNYFNFLSSVGLLDLPEEMTEFDGTRESFEKVIEHTQKNTMYKGAELLMQQLPTEFQKVLEYGLNGGTSLPNLESLLKGQVDLNQYDLEDRRDQETIVKQYLKKSTKYSDSQIKKYISRLVKLDELEIEAEEALKGLDSIQKKELETLNEDAKKQKEENQKKLTETFNSFKTTVQNLKATPTRKDKILRSVWAVGDYGGVKNISYFDYIDSMIKQNPEHLVQLAELYLDYDPNKGFLSNAIEQRATTKANKSLKNSIDALNKGSKRKVNSTKRPKKKKSNNTLLDNFSFDMVD